VAEIVGTPSLSLVVSQFAVFNGKMSPEACEKKRKLVLKLNPEGYHTLKDEMMTCDILCLAYV